MTEIKKRNINPENKPGPKPIDGEVRSRTLIIKMTNTSFEDLKHFCEDNEIIKANFVRDAIDEKLNKLRG